jgi:hypothetical protein
MVLGGLRTRIAVGWLKMFDSSTDTLRHLAGKKPPHEITPIFLLVILEFLGHSTSEYNFKWLL